MKDNLIINLVLHVIEDYYGDAFAKRTGVPYMNHIYEGLNVMSYLKMPLKSKIAYILHPIFQNESLENGTSIILDGLSKYPEEFQEVLNDTETREEFSNSLLEGWQYKKYANAYLSTDHTIGATFEIDPLMPSYVKDALIADKIQNYKDFSIYHKNSHPNAELLEDYFKAWFKALDISDNVYEECKPHCRKLRITFFTGAGVSAESGIDTFRDADGTWEKVKIEDVATPAAWSKNRELVLDFYNKRILQLDQVEPNDAHKAIAKFQKRFDVTVVTQNVDDLHERAGSEEVVHLHGELRKKCSSLRNGTHITDIPKGETIELGSKCPDGSQWRPHIVWFGEAVPRMEDALEVVLQADKLVVIGTSLNVYPAAGIFHFVSSEVPIYQIDPNEESLSDAAHFKIQDTATNGMKYLLKTIVI